MSFLGIGSGTKKRRIRAAVDMGSHAIKAVLFAGGAGGAPRILKKTVTRLPLGIERLRVVSTLHEMMSLMVRSSGVMPEDAVIAIGPDLADFAEDSWHEKLPFQTSAVSPAKLQEFVRGMERAHTDPERITFFYPTSVCADGYPATDAAGDPFRKGMRFLRAPNDEISHDIYVSALTLSFPRDIGDALTEARFSWGGMAIDFIPLSVAYHEVLGGMPDYRQSEILFDIGGEATTLMRRDNGRIRTVRIIPRGVRHIIRALAAHASVALREAEDSLRHYTAGISRPGDAEQIREAIAPAIAEWKNILAAALGEDCRHGPLSGSVILCGGGAAIPEMVSALRENGWLHQVSYASAPAVRILAANNFFEGNSLGGFLNGPEDAGLAALMRYAERPT